ncbi:MAG: ABC transporter permease [Dehalococcoidia bacterium]|nr:ABC transporter permease [Dehalococcoidia bacterium]
MNSLKVAAFLAFKSLTRGDWRVLLLTISMLILVYLNLVFTPALLAGAVQNINNKTRTTMSADLLFQATGESPVLFQAQELVDAIENVDGVAAVCARNNLGAEIHYESETFATGVYAIDPEKDDQVFQIHEAVIEGEPLEPGDVGQILLGAQVAGAEREDLELYASSLKTVHAGSTVVIDYVNGVEREYTVKGIFFTEFVQSDIRAYITEDDLHTMVPPQLHDTATSIYVKLEKGVDRSQVVNEVLAMRSGLKYQTWEDALGVLKSMTKSFDQIIVILRVTALIVAAITIFIVTYVDLVNKRRQIGIERAIGITSSSIVASYILRAIIYAAFGILAAALIFRYIVVPIEAQHPFHFPFGDVMLAVDVPELVSSAFILCGVAIASAFVPAYQTIRTKIIDAIWSS